ncbi:MAG: hypothetical protein ACAF41_15230 [Leptolyngbya sp. BL-A-14]
MNFELIKLAAVSSQLLAFRPTPHSPLPTPFFCLLPSAFCPHRF